MLTLAPDEILLDQRAASKDEAIALLASRLEAAALVEPGYLAGMQAREAQHATYLGNGIAIPHGTTETRHLVRQTGVRVAQFPQGVEWDEGHKAYLVIAIAAKSDEHLGILRQLTRVLGDEAATERLRTTRDVTEIIRVLSGEGDPLVTGATGRTDGQRELAALAHFPALSLDELLLGAGARAKSLGWLDTQALATLLGAAPLHLGQGVWLARTAAGQAGWLLATPAQPLVTHGHEVNALLLLCANGRGHEAELGRLVELTGAGRLGELARHGLTLLQGEAAPVASQSDGHRATFTIVNPHGLHARPGAMLVKVAKEYEAEIRVANLDGSGEEVNAKSLMKVIGLGVKCGHRLAFRAEGTDAGAALEGLGEAIAAGLGEGAGA